MDLFSDMFSGMGMDGEGRSGQFDGVKMPRGGPGGSVFVGTSPSGVPIFRTTDERSGMAGDDSDSDDYEDYLYVSALHESCFLICLTVYSVQSSGSGIPCDFLFW